MECVEAVEIFSANSAKFRYRVPVSVIRDLSFRGSRYSQEFEVGGWLWRFHLQERKFDDDNFLAVHLQSCSQGSIPAHFKLSLVNIYDRLSDRNKTFHCTFKKAGSAWGLHQFISLKELLSKRSPFVYQDEESGALCIDLEVQLQVDAKLASPRASPSRTASPQRASGQQPLQQQRPQSPSRGVSPRSAPLNRSLMRPSSPAGYAPAAQGMVSASRASVSARPSVNRRGVSPMMPPPGARRNFTDPAGSMMLDGSVVSGINTGPRASLVYPYEHLEILCDMSFDVQGKIVKAHRCVIGARMKSLLPEQMLPLQVGCVVSINVPMGVFSAFLRYVYTEDLPEAGFLPCESLLDLYLLASACEFYDMCAVCLEYVRPLLTADNILPIVLSRYSATDDVLNTLYLRVLVENYDRLILDKQCEEIPGHLFRRLSLIQLNKEQIPTIPPQPPMKNTLSRQLGWLAESGEYADFEWVVGPQGFVLQAHKYIIACRSVVFSQSANPRNPAPLPSLSGQEFDFSHRTWSKFLINMYKHNIEFPRDVSGEDIAIIFKLQNALAMDGLLKRQADDAFSSTNALRLLIYAVKHQVAELHERAASFAANNFQELVRNDPQAWELISELPQPAVISLFRTVVERVDSTV